MIVARSGMGRSSIPLTLKALHAARMIHERGQRSRVSAPNESAPGHGLLRNQLPSNSAAPRSPTMMVAALVLADTTRGMTEASITRKPSTPCTRS